MRRIRIEELCRVAELHIASASGLDTAVAGKPVAPEVVNPPEWAARTLSDWKPLLSLIADAHAAPLDGMEDGIAADIPGLPPLLARAFGQAAQAIGPAMLGMQLGSSIGYLARRVFGQYDLPIPRSPSEKILFVPHNIATFADDWSLPADDVCLWVCMREVAHHAVLSIAHVRDHIQGALEEYARNFSPEPSILEERIAAMDLSEVSDIEQLQQLFGDPSEILARMVGPEQGAARDQISAVVAALEGWVDHVMDSIGQTLISSYGPITEALRRRRVVREEGERYIDVLFGLTMDQQAFARGSAFVEGVVERAGGDGLAKLWSRPEHLPTPADVDAPGLWLERISYVE